MSFYLVCVLFSLVFGCNGLEEHSALVGGLCKDTCDDDLLYCSPQGVCLCDREYANFVYEYRHHFTVREPKCEVLPCTLAKPEEKNECNLRHAKCLPHKDGNDTTGYCKCPGSMVGARRGTAFTLSQCKDVKVSNVGEKCISNLYVCDINKKLKCRDGTCECYEGYHFSFKQDICIKKQEYIDRHGYDKFGTYGDYCSRTPECLDGMYCKNKRCDCPNFCRSGEYIQTKLSCYCAFDMTKLAYIIPSIVISFLFLLFFIGFCYFNKKYEESLQSQTNLVLVHGRKTPISSIPHYLYKDGCQSPFITTVSPGQQTPSTKYVAQSPNYRQHIPPQESEETDWSIEDMPQELSGVDLNLQANGSDGGTNGCAPEEVGGGTYSFFPPPPYQLNEMVAAEMVEAQMRQGSPSTVQYMEPN